MKSSKICALVLVMTLLFSGCSLSDYSTAIYANWQINMPSGAEEIYYVKSPSSFNGDGIRYHVFAYEDDKDVEDWLNFSTQQQATIFADDYQGAINNWFEELGKNIKEPVNYENCLYYYQKQNDNSEIIIVLNKSEKRIYVIESFM